MKHTTKLRRHTPKRAALERQVGPERYSLVMSIAECELCGTRELATLALHELARGGSRVQAIGTRFATLCLCNPQCHREVEKWKPAKQLCLLRAVRPLDFNLSAYNRIVNRQVTIEEVDGFENEVQLALGKSRPDFDLWA